MIRVQNVDKYFNRFKKNKIHVINNTSLEFEDTGLVALLGPSGSGKTTLLNVIGGLDKVRRGKIFVDGKKITRRGQNAIDKIRNLNIGYIFQDYKLIEDKSVYDNVALSLKLIGIKDKKEIDKRVCYVLDRVGMLRYKKRPCNMLSGGERQRVGIARAIVKNPNIIIADEPTGNLDSKNSIEIMNIIKSISKDKLVILVTHEKNLAQFYATRIIEIEDGKVIRDLPNEIPDELNYDIVNNIYLKDFEEKKSFDDIHVYSNQNEKISLDIAVVHNNIYIRTNSNYKVEVIDEDSTIEMIDDHYKNISKSDVDKYEFNFKNIINEEKKIKYSSIFNPISFITNGFHKVLNYPVLKKILLLGFFLSGIFIMYAVSSIAATMIVKEEKFISINKNYLIVEAKKIKLDDYYSLENSDLVEYILPTDSQSTIALQINDFYQFTPFNLSITGSVSDIGDIQKKDILLGRMSENENEVVVEQMILKKLLKKNDVKMLGFHSTSEFLDRELEIDVLPNMKIVGIVDLKSPSIYMERSKMIPVLYHTSHNTNDEFNSISISSSYYNDEEEKFPYDDYHFYINDFTLKEGRLPDNDYETILPYSEKESHKLNSEIDKKVNDHKLKVVGYYETKQNFHTYFVNYQTMKNYFILKSSNISIYPKNKEETLLKVREDYHMNIKDSYQSSRDKYLEQKRSSMRTTIISSGIILAISLIEILLMMRSSFLSRVKEVGVYRAIGVKKKDIYTMFSGEIIAITTMASIPGILLSAYIINILTKIDAISELFVVNVFLVVVSTLLIYVFNLIVGLIPVFMTIRKRPAEILSRTDI